MLALAVLLPMTNAAKAAEPTEAVAWDFAGGIQEWQGNNTTPLEVVDGALHFEATGSDVGIVGPLFDITPDLCDVIEITLKSTAEGVCEWFWRSDTDGPYGGFSGEKRLQVSVDASDDWQTLRVQPFWQEAEQVIGLRFDPPEGKEGTYDIASIKVLKHERPGPVEASFDFTRGDEGWVVPVGETDQRQAGWDIIPTSPDTRAISPRLDLDAAGARYLIIEATASVVPSPELTIPAFIEFMVEGSTTRHAVPFTMGPALRSTYNVRVGDHAGWRGRIETIMLGLGSSGDTTLHSLRASAGPSAGEARPVPATGLEFQTESWRREYRLPVAPTRIDVSTEAPPETVPVGSDYTIAMWYFAAWEPEYTWDGWKQVAERAPWRIPLLYDPDDAEMRQNGIQFYRASDGRVIDWHVHWMREHAVNLMMWDWYPGTNDDGAIDPGFFGNRALEVGFLGKDEVGAPPTETNRFAETMPFAVMVTNHPPFAELPTDMGEYVADHFFSQPNYYRMDGEPMLLVWDTGQLVRVAGGEEEAAAYLNGIRETARDRGHQGVYIAAVNGTSQALLDRLGIDGATGYVLARTGGERPTQRQLGERAVTDYLEDFPTQTISGHVDTWMNASDALGRDYLLATTPMQNWEPTYRPTGFVFQRQTPDAYREMLRRAKVLIEERGLRKFVAVEAWNEWLEGSYVEPSTQWGTSYLEAIRDIFGEQ